MAKIICTLPNASELISGVRFVSHKLGMISEEIEDEVAAGLAKIRGYVLADKKGKPVEPEPSAPAGDSNTGGTAPPSGVQGAGGPVADGAAAKTE